MVQVDVLFSTQNISDLHVTESPSKSSRCCISVSSVSSSDDDGLTTQSSISDNQYADLTFWKPLLPTVDDEIAALLSDNQKQTDRKMQRREVEAHYYGPIRTGIRDVTSGDDGGTEFSEFNFWRVPIAVIDAELSLMLGSLELWTEGVRIWVCVCVSSFRPNI